MGKKEKPSETLAEDVQDLNTEQKEQTTEDKGKTSKKRSKKKNKEEELTLALEEKEGQVTEIKDKYMRLLAEFENFKKRNIKEKLEMMSTAGKDTMSALLPILDDFDRAKKIADDENTEETFSEGVNLVYNKLHSVLAQKGLEAMESTGNDFDPELHEAITEIPTPDETMKGKVIDTVEKGYLLKDKIIRYAKVVVGK